MEQRYPVVVLGKEIGTFTDWDIHDTCHLYFDDVELNDVGKKFLPTVTAPTDIGIDFNTGVVSVYDTAGEATELKSDWSVFNKA